MTDEELSRLRDQMYHDEIEVPEQTEKELIDVAHHTAQMLYFHPSRMADFEFLGHNYRARYVDVVTTDYHHVMLVVMDDLTDKRRIKGQVQINNGLSELENIRAVVAAMLRHHTGMTEVGEITDDEDE